MKNEWFRGIHWVTDHIASEFGLCIFYSVWLGLGCRRIAIDDNVCNFIASSPFLIWFWRSFGAQILSVQRRKNLQVWRRSWWRTFLANYEITKQLKRSSANEFLIELFTFHGRQCPKRRRTLGRKFRPISLWASSVRSQWIPTIFRLLFSAPVANEKQTEELWFIKRSFLQPVSLSIAVLCRHFQIAHQRESGKSHRMT